MPLSDDDLRLLSGLLDEALALPPPRRDAWLRSLPPAQRHLEPRLRRALQQVSGGAELTLPALAVPEVDEPAPAAGDRIGPYRLVAEIGRGGMGRVWHARRGDGLYERDVALKLPRLPRSESLAHRMADERRIGARLEHPRIARLYDAGIDDQGRPYLVMELVQGLDLVRHAAERRLGVRQRVDLMLQVCDAVSHAHRHLVVHRDLKPSNIMVDTSGQVRLLDFGVARLLEGDDTQPSATLGISEQTHTPRYAAPEQVWGLGVTTATDIYALGVVSYELLTGTVPGERWPSGPGDDPQRAVPVAPPSRGAIAEGHAARCGLADDLALRRAIGPELDAVLLHALQVRPQDRVASVEAFADDLRAVLDDRLPRAAAPSAGRRARLFARRHRWRLAWTGGAALALSAVAALGLAERLRNQDQAQRLAELRSFMLGMIAATEPQAGQPVPAAQAAQVLDSTLTRARTALADQPVLRAEVFSQVAVMQRRFGRPAEALALLREAHELMERHAADADSGRHAVAAQLAMQWVEDLARGGDAEAAQRAEALARGALSACSAPDARCARARAMAWSALGNAATLRGDDPAALAAARHAVAESDAGFGPGHPESTMARVNLAIGLRNADQPQAALALVQQAAAAARVEPPRSADLRQLHLVQAMVLADNGQHAAALSGMQALIADAGGPATDAALLHRLRALSLFEQGLLPEALQAAGQVLAAVQDRDDPWEAAHAHAVRARALAAQGSLVPARAALQDWRAAVQRLGGPPKSLAPLRLRRGEAEVALRDGRADEAQATVRPLTEGEFSAQPVSPLELSLSLDLLGAVLQRLHRPREALAPHRRAAGLLAALLPDTHPLRLRNALLQARAAALDAAGEDSRAALRRAAERYLAALPAASAWRGAAQALIDAPVSEQSPVP